MHILLVTHNVSRGDGQGRVNLEIARHCLSQGHRVTLVAGQVDPALIADGAAWAPVHQRIKRPALFRHWRFARLVDRTMRDLRATADVVVGNGYGLTRPHDVNMSHFVHGAWRKHERVIPRRPGPRAVYHSVYSRINADLERVSYGAARLVVAISDRVRTELLEIGVPDAKIRVIHNGVDLEEFRPGPADRSELGLPPGVPLGLFVGDICTFRKNLDTVLRAMTRSPLVHLAVVGKIEGSPFPSLASALGVAGRIHFLGFRRDVAQLMRGCDFLAFPPRYEPFGLVILEAMSCGLPVVTTRIAGAAEIMDESCGVLLDNPEDVDKLADAMTKFTDAGRRVAAGSHARRLAEGHGWTRMAEQYLSVFNEIACDLK